MLNTLIIYDNTGYIYSQVSGNFKEPIGLQYLITDIPDGYVVNNIDVSLEPHQPIFEEIPKSQVEIDIDKVKADNEMLKLMVADLGLQVGGGL